eukprot:659920-Pleurochrysis_carterae.AAC.1
MHGGGPSPQRLVRYCYHVDVKLDLNLSDSKRFKCPERSRELKTPTDQDKTWMCAIALGRRMHHLFSETGAMHDDFDRFLGETGTAASSADALLAVASGLAAMDL